MTAPLDAVLAYHQRTKHHLHRYAAAPGGLDWKNQPDPFRQFAGSPQLELPLLADETQPRYVDLYRPRAIPPQALTLTTLAALLELAFGISAWKQYGDSRWALRCNPSSGNLHPTEAYVVVTGIADIDDGVHHYVSRDHRFEQRCRFDSVPGERLLPPDCFLVDLTSIHWREAWKYGERAYRYCQHDAGHAIAAVRFAAATLGWRARLLASVSDADNSALLGLDRDADFGPAEREHPDALLLVTARAPVATDGDFEVGACVRAARRGQWHGRANPLSPRHGHDWPVIDEVAKACAKPPTREINWQAPALPEPLASDCDQSAIEIIKRRRSAQAFDGVTSISARDFYRMLDMTLPRPATPPWDAIGWEPRVHLALFVHRVDGVAPGLHLFLRNDRVETTLRAELPAEFEWQRAQDCPAHLRLYRLAAGDARAAARTLSCHQDIAADGAFSLGMLAEYEATLTHGPWIYRQLFWETGILGQVLYLEAEAAGVRGTGIGCFFDDAVHELLGLKGRALQSLYHFTTGGALADTRLQTLPAYAHLKRT
ncbi:MAG: nitroreductase [Bacteroidota bacterium]